MYLDSIVKIILIIFGLLGIFAWLLMLVTNGGYNPLKILYEKYVKKNN